MESSTANKKCRPGCIRVLAIVILFLVFGAVAGFIVFGNQDGGSVLTQNLSQPLGDAAAARFDFNVGTGNLTIDSLTGGEPLLAGGTLEYPENKGLPAETLVANGSLVTYALKADGGREGGMLFPWEVCNGAFDWQLHLNPTVPADITAISGGGNLQLDLAGMIVTNLVAETGGGNVDVVLPDGAADLSVKVTTGGGNVTVTVGSNLTGSHSLVAASGAGNVVVRLPEGTAARIHAGSGLGGLNIDPQFIQIDDQIYETPDYLDAADKIEITLESGAGDVEVVIY